MWVKTESNSIIPPKFFDTVPELVHWAEATPGLDAMRVYNTNGEPIQSMAYGIFRFSMMLKSGMTVAVSHLSGQNIVFTPAVPVAVIFICQVKLTASPTRPTMY